MRAKAEDEVFGETLGSTLRAARLGFHWMAELGAYVRIREAPDGWAVQVAPRGAMPTKGAAQQYRVWWETPEGEQSIEVDLLAICRRVLGGEARVTRLKQAVGFVIDDSGQFRCWAAAA